MSGCTIFADTKKILKRVNLKSDLVCDKDMHQFVTSIPSSIQVLSISGLTNKSENNLHNTTHHNMRTYFI